MRISRQAAGLIIVFAVLCVAFGARTLIELDTVGLALAVDQPDLRAHQPPPPGSILYVWFAQFCSAWIGNPWWALRIVSVVALVGAAILTSGVAARLAAPHAAPLAFIVFLASPLVLFHGMTASSFAADAFVSALIAFLCVRALERKATSLRVESYLIGLFLGLRPQALVLMLPLWVWTLMTARVSRRDRLLAVVAWLAGAACWAVPLVKHAGGLSRYLDATWTLALDAARGSVVGGEWSGLARHTQQAGIALLCGLGITRILWLLVVRARTPQDNARSTRQIAAPSVLASTAFWSAWLAPVMLWSLFYSLPAPGALLGLWPALCVLFAMAWTRVPHGRAGSRLIVAAIVLDTLLFFAVPISQLEGPARVVFGDAQFFHERVQQTPLTATLDTLRVAEVDTRQALFLGSAASHRALAYWAPNMPMVHADALRPYALLLYRERRARVVADSYEVPAEVRWVIVGGRAEQFSRSPTALLGPAWPRASRGGMEIVRVGPGPIDAWFVPEQTTKTALRLHLVRGLPPSDPTDAAPQRARLDSGSIEGSQYGAITR